jgi:hypothetical protein
VNNKERPNVEKISVIEAYRIRWTDGESWRVVRDMTNGGAWSVMDPNGKVLDKSHPMWEKCVKLAADAGK